MNPRSRNLHLLIGLSPLLRDEFILEAVKYVWELLDIQEALQESSEIPPSLN